MNVAEAFHNCHICNKDNAQGIWLVNGYLCSGCLDEISSTNVKDPKYGYFVAKLKELWQTG